MLLQLILALIYVCIIIEGKPSICKTMGISYKTNVNDCLSSPCQHGKCKDVENNNNIDDCAVNPCKNGGSCIDLVNDFKCVCELPYTGRECQDRLDPCQPNLCQHNSKCTPSSNFLDFACSCELGYTGRFCEEDVDECVVFKPCKKGATCINTNGSYKCMRMRSYKGNDSSINTDDCTASSCQNGKIRTPNGLNTVYAGDLEKQRQQCIRNKCPIKRGNMRCDEECNTYACDFDGNECSLGINPWANCTTPTKCWEVFMDGVCNEDCNNSQCLFDGRDCENKLQACNPIYNAYCKKHYANGYCDYGCNNAECDWDGLDCENELPKLAHGAISMVILKDMGEFRNNLVAFLRDISHQLRTTVRVKKDHLENYMINPWIASTSTNNLQLQQAKTGIKIFLEIDNRKCSSLTKTSDYCFQTASDAAKFLAAKASKHTLLSSFSIYQVNGSTEMEEDDNPPLNKKIFLTGRKFQSWKVNSSHLHSIWIITSALSRLGRFILFLT